MRKSDNMSEKFSRQDGNRKLNLEKYNSRPLQDFKNWTTFFLSRTTGFYVSKLGLKKCYNVLKCLSKPTPLDLCHSWIKIANGTGKVLISYP